MKLALPDPSLVLLIGPSGAGKSTFAARHFQPTEIVSSDRCRALVADDEADQNVNREAFSLLHHIVRARAALRRLSVIDATNLETAARYRLLYIAEDYQLPAVAIVFNLSLEKCLQQNLRRPDRIVNEEVLSYHQSLLERTLPGLEREGYFRLYWLDETNREQVVIERFKN